MAEIETLSLIKEVDLFKNLSDEELSRILHMAFVKDYETGILLFNEGQEGNVMFVILSGFVLSVHFCHNHAIYQVNY